MRVLCLVGTRPEAIKMAPVILALRKSGAASVTVLSTGQHRDLIRNTLSTFGIGIDDDLEVMTHDQSLAQLSARLLTALDAFLLRHPQDYMSFRAIRPPS